MAKLQEESVQVLKCGLIMPISSIDGCSSEHWEEVRVIIKEALSDTAFQVELVSDSNEIGVIQNRIVNNIYNSDIVICDVSGKNPNVMFELGMRLAFDKPTIIIKDDKTNYSFDTAPIEHIEYPRDLHYPSILEFKQILKKKLQSTFDASQKPEYTTFLKHFGEFKIAKVSQKEISSDQYILETLNNLAESVKRLERNNRVPIKNMSRGLSLKGHPALLMGGREKDKLFEDAIAEYKAMKKLESYELFEHIEDLTEYVTNVAITKTGMFPPDARLMVNNEITDYIDL